MTEIPSISIIVPVLNEEGSLDKFYNGYRHVDTMKFCLALIIWK